MRHAVFFLLYNVTEAQLDLSKRALDSIVAQDVGPMDIYIVNNGSTDPTYQWLESICPVGASTLGEHWVYIEHFETNQSPSWVSNRKAKTIFANHDYVLGVPNDVVLPKNVYRELLSWPRGLVGAFMNGDENNIVPCEKSKAIHEDVHMAVCLTRKWCYEALLAKDGFFYDEGFFMYGSDVDFKLRLAACGIHGVQTDIQVYHYGSACWRLSTPEVSQAINRQADKDRAYFAKKYGVSISDPRCGEAVNDLNFKGMIAQSKIWTPE